MQLLLGDNVPLVEELLVAQEVSLTLCLELQLNQRLDSKLLLHRNLLLTTEMRLKHKLTAMVLLKLEQERAGVGVDWLAHACSKAVTGPCGLPVLLRLLRNETLHLEVLVLDLPLEVKVLAVGELPLERLPECEHLLHLALDYEVMVLLMLALHESMP